ncbi:hypothetical protein PAPYR_9447 [Paratrimastix pyriformis]|uniref:Uncharacterized protein n=1 Tax=Paratrimastix pyriformis TaxID=342808 RepID=A0ABQ8UAW7_9EUKA|nr:hypothetical protein PAPYR_9447 [Paratrimastix pyriformis]
MLRQLLLGAIANLTALHSVISYVQAASRLASYEDRELSLEASELRFMESAFRLDLTDGLDRITMVFTRLFDETLGSLLRSETVLFALSLAALLVSWLFLFRVNLVKGELTKTALMRALLPSSAFEAFGHTSLKALTPVNVGRLDELRAAMLDGLNATRDAIADEAPNEELVDTYGGALDAMRALFEAEEHLMSKHKMPHRINHHRAHAILLAQYGGPLEDLHRGHAEALERLTALLRDRAFLTHAAQMDGPLGHFLNRHGVY